MRTLNAYLFLATFIFSGTQTFAALPFFQNFGNPEGCPLFGNNYYYAGEVVSTEFDTLYSTECYFINPLTVTLKESLVPGQGYTMYLHFSEIYYGEGNPIQNIGDGGRIFHVDVDGIRVLNNFDIHGIVGPRQAMVFKYNFVADADGFAKLTFTPVVNNAKISAVEIVELDEESLYPPTTSIYDLNNGSFPVELLDLDARTVGNQVQVTWTTVWETNNAGFDIQMGNYYGGFSTVGFVEGAGNSTEALSYQFTTPNLGFGTYVFRLKQRDFDGKVSFSPMVEATIGNQLTSSMQPLVPNPATEYTLLRFFGEEGDDVLVSVHSLHGQELSRIYDAKLPQGGQHSLPISTGDLIPGIYFVQLVQEGHVMTQRLMISPK